MPNRVDKVKKQIAKKHNGVLPPLHKKSRNSLRLHKAIITGEHRDKASVARALKEQPILDRAHYFQERFLETDSDTLDVPAIQELITNYIQELQEEYEALKQARRPGRPGSVKEVSLKTRIDALKQEYKQGFLVPDMIDPEQAKSFSSFEGSWSYLASVAWIKVNEAGQSRPAEFPSKGLN